MTAIGATSSPLSARGEHDRQVRNRALVRYWLYFVLLTLFALVLVGGATRLTDSGLSITEWKPVHGVVPPLSESDWEEEFAKYRQIPEYQQINRGMSLTEFKRIFWWEWAHRLLARGVGVVFALPLVFFWATRRLEPGLAPRLAGLLLLGGVQGAVGWWMVASGLVDRVDVSQYRLAAHLGLACLIFAATMMVARGLAPHSEAMADRVTTRFAFVLLAAVFVQILLGGLVAGLDAGFSYNEWPLMDGAVVPSDLMILEPAWRNFFENPKTVQYVHRMAAYLLLAIAFWHAIETRRRQPGTTHARRALVLFHLILVQAVIGIVTLVMVSPPHLALLHQAVALGVLGFAAAHWRAASGPYPLRTEIAVRA